MTPLPLRNPSASFTRPNDTTAYASGDLVANNTAAGSVAAMAFQVARSREGSFAIIGARIRKSGVAVANASFRLHLYRSASNSSTGPTVANGDNAAWSSNGAAEYLGSIDITVDKAFTDGAAGDGVPVASSVATEQAVKLDGRDTRLFGLLEARAAYTPAANEVFTVTLEIVPQT
jgi:hypothetical protein